MKRSNAYLPLYLLPLFGLGAGCTQSTPPSAPAPAPAPVAASDPIAPPPEADEATYKVVSEGAAGMPPKLLEELPKVELPPPPATMTVSAKPVLVMTTSKGKITLELDSKAAPLHVKSFVYLAGKKYFDGTTIHRYEPSFVVQGGDPLTREARNREYGGLGGPGYQIPREYNSLKHDAFVLAAARTTDPDSAGSQYYITLAPAPNLDFVPGQDPGYTVYGKVTQGKDVVLKLRKHDVIKSVVLQK